MQQPYQIYSTSDVGRIGFVSQEDANQFNLDPTAWTKARNVRFQNGSAEAARGWVGAIQVPQNQRGYLSYTVGFGGIWWLIWRQDSISAALYPFDGPANTVIDVTRVDEDGEKDPYHYSADSFWSVTDFQGIPVGTNGLDVPQAQFEAGETAGVPRPGTRFVDLPGWTDGARANLIIAHKGFLIAANFNDDGYGLPHPTLVAWSDVAEVGNLPDNWAFADPTSLSGRNALPAHTGPITAIKVLGDSVYLFTAETAYRMSFIGGQYIWRFERVTGRTGAFNPWAVAEVPGALISVTADDIRIFDGLQSTSIIAARAREYFFSRISSDWLARAICVAYPKEHEVWIIHHNEDAADESMGEWEGAASAFETWDEIDDALGASNTWADLDPHYWDEFEISDSNFALVINWAEQERPWATRDVPFLFHAAYLPAQKQLDREATVYQWDQYRRYPDLDSWVAGGSTPWNSAAITSELGDYSLYGISSRDLTVYQMDTGVEHQWADNYDQILEREDINLGGDEFAQLAKYIYPRAQVQAEQNFDNTYTYWDEVSTLWDSMTGTWDQATVGHTALSISIGDQVVAGADVDWRTAKEFVYGMYRVAVRCRGRRHALRLLSAKETWTLGGYDIEFSQAGRFHRRNVAA